MFSPVIFHLPKPALPKQAGMGGPPLSARQTASSLDLSQDTVRFSGLSDPRYRVFKHTTPFLVEVEGSPVSDTFKESVETALAEIPLPMRQFVASEGGTIVLSKFLTGARPDWQEKYGYRSTNRRRGRASPETNSLYMAEFYLGRISGKRRPSSRKRPIERTLIHEFCHLTDYSLKRKDLPSSDSLGFERAYCADVAALTPQEWRDYDYYMPDSDVSNPYREVFCEVLAALTTKQGLEIPEQLLEKFPRTAQWMRDNVLPVFPVQPLR